MQILQKKLGLFIWSKAVIQIKDAKDGSRPDGNSTRGLQSTAWSDVLWMELVTRGIPFQWFPALVGK